VSPDPHPDFQPEIAVLYCRQTLDPEVRPPEGPRQAGSCQARLVLLPCSSKVEAFQMLRLLEQGADGVHIVACPEKACRFLVGNQRAERRVAHARELLQQIGMGEERINFTRGADLAIDDLLALAKAQAEKVKSLGPNPMKGGSLP
jgi:F420-non-reducing hydrogenase iron-sulfur subunit